MKIKSNIRKEIKSSTSIVMYENIGGEGVGAIP